MKLPKMKRKKIVAIDLWQWNCRNGRKKKQQQLICGNVVARMEGEKNCVNGVGENWRERELSE